jgi:uncharacterized SAM-binding protein YcdF (DUF218 family)
MVRFAREHTTSGRHMPRTSGSRWVRRTFRVLIFFVGFLALLGTAAWIFRKPLLTWSADSWMVTDNVDAPVDAVLILGGGAERRTLAAYDLYHRGLTRRIVIAKSRLDAAARFELSPPHTELVHQALIKLGVPDDAITVFGNDLNSTYEEAKAAALWARSNNIHSVAIVTEWVVTRRARWVFEKEMQLLGIEIKIQRTQDETDFAPENWWRNENGIVAFQNEILKYLYYRIRY